MKPCLWGSQRILIQTGMLKYRDLKFTKADQAVLAIIAKNENPVTSTEPPGLIAFEQLSTDSQFCKQLDTPISTQTAQTNIIRGLYFVYQYTGQIISIQMMPPLRSFDDVDGKERGQKKTDDPKAMTTLGPRTL